MIALAVLTVIFCFSILLHTYKNQRGNCFEMLKSEVDAISSIK